MTTIVSTASEHGVDPPPQELLPESMGNWADWVADVIAAGITFVGPISGLALAVPILGSQMATIVNILGFVLSAFLLVWVSLASSNVEEWSERYTGWFSPVVLVGISANVACGVLAAIFALTASP